MNANELTHLRVWSVWLGGAVVSVAMSTTLHRYNRAQQFEQFDQLVVQAAAEVTQRMERLAHGLRATRGAVAAAGFDAISRARFADYAQAASLATEYPGATGMGFIRHVPANQTLQFLEHARQEGPSDFSIRKLEDPLPHASFVIQYVEPLEPNQAAVGLDVASEPRRRDAALRSAWLDEPAITAPITLVQASQAPLQAVLIMLPIYRPGMPLHPDDDRLQATLGWAYAPLRIEQVLHGLAPANGLFDFELHDQPVGATGTPRVKLAASVQAANAKVEGLVKTHALSIMGREWALTIQARPTFVRQLRQFNPVVVGVASVMGWSLLVGIWLLLQSTRRKSRALELQESRMAALVAQSEDAVLAIDLHGRVTDWNPAATRIFGHTRDDAEGQLLETLLVPPDLRQEAHHTLERAMRGESVPPFDTIRLHRDGTSVPVSISISPVRDTRGRVVGVAKISRDISERKASEARILELNAALEAEVGQTRRREQVLLNQALSTVIVTDATGGITLFNRAAEQLLGYTAEEVVGRAVMSQFHDDQEVRQRVRAASQQLGRKLWPGEVFLPHIRHVMGDRNEWLYVHKDGTRIPMLLTVGALHDEQNQLSGFIGIGTDLRDRKKLEADLSQAEKAGRAKDQFLANMSHEMRTPLNAILGLTFVLSQSQLDASQQDLLAKTRSATRTLLALVNDLLDLTKIEAGEMALQPHPTALHTLLADAVSLAAATAYGKPVQCVLDAQEDVHRTVLVDALRLQQMLSNLLGNAIKFTREGTVVLRARTTALDPQRMLLRLEVQDTGPGISQDAQRRLFQRFSQASPDIARQFGGTGLGLSIVRNLAQLMGGQVGLQSKLGEGSTFWLELPLPVLTQAEASQQPTLTTQPGPARGVQRLRGVHILVVDDSAINREVVERILAAEGATVRQAADGQTAMEHLLTPNHHTDLVLLDMQMPVADGPSVARSIRQITKLARLPIFALTASALQSERDRAFESGMTDFVVKPFDPEDLVQRIRRQVAVPSANTGAESIHPSEATATTHPSTMAAISEPSWKGRLVQNMLDEYRDWLHPAAQGQTAADSTPAHEQTSATAQRLHKLKGSAGMLGLTELHHAASAAEQAVLALTAASPAPSLEPVLAAVREALQLAAQTHATAKEAATITPAEHSTENSSLSQSEWKLLLQLLEQNSLDAVDSFQRLRPALCDLLPAPQVAELEDALGRLQFIQVRQALLQAGIDPTGQ